MNKKRGYSLIALCSLICLSSCADDKNDDKVIEVIEKNTPVTVEMTVTPEKSEVTVIDCNELNKSDQDLNLQLPTLYTNLETPKQFSIEVSQAMATNLCHQVADYKSMKELPVNIVSMPSTCELSSNPTGLTCTLDLDKIRELPTGTYLFAYRLTDLQPAEFSTNNTFSFVKQIQVVAESSDEASGVPQIYNNQVLVWNAEFDHVGALDSDDWGNESGYVRNNEYQWYQAENASCDGECLNIVAKRIPDGTMPNPKYVAGSTDWKKKREYIRYTSASVATNKRHYWKYGTFLVRAKIPAVKGSWPAIWTLGRSQEWPSCGEIDIMEYYKGGILANVCWGTTTRWSGKWDSSFHKMDKLLERDPDWPNKFHVWKMEWTEEYIKLYVDDILLNTTDVSKTVNPGNAKATAGFNPFKQEHYLKLNLAIGGNNGGDPSNTTFPLTYKVDYVRVYQ